MDAALVVQPGVQHRLRKGRIRQAGFLVPAVGRRLAARARRHVEGLDQIALGAAPRHLAGEDQRLPVRRADMTRLRHVARGIVLATAAGGENPRRHQPTAGRAALPRRPMRTLFRVAQLDYSPDSSGHARDTMSTEKSWYAPLGMRWPLVQAALGGGISTAELAIAVSRAGGLGTIGLMPEPEFEAEIDRAKRELGDTPFAVNLLMPLMRRRHLRACVDKRVPVVSVFFGHDPDVVKALKDAGSYVIYQVGSEAEADTVLRDGADAVIVQGVEAGGHVRATERLDVLLPRIRTAHPDVPVLAAGGIFDVASVRRAMALGADGVAVGTRFLMTPESNAHDAYKQCLLEADETVLTDLFGLGWNAPHRVALNAATRRWCRDGALGPRWVSRFNTLSETPSRLLPLSAAASMIRMEHPAVPLFGPFPLHRKMQPRTDVAPLYAGEPVARIKDIRPADEIVRELATAFE